MLIPWRNVVNFLISSMVLGLLNQLPVFWQLYLIALLGLLSTGLGILEMWHLIYPRLLIGFVMLVFFTKLKSYEISGLFKNIQLIMEFLMAPFLAWHFSYHTFMTFLMLFSVKLLSVLMILLSILSVIRHLVCGNN